MAGITTPFINPQFPFIQTATNRTLNNVNPAFVLSKGPSVPPASLTPDAGLGQGVFTVNRGLGSGYVQQWNLTIEQELTNNFIVEIAYSGNKITHLGIPDTNMNQLTVDQLQTGKFAAGECAEPLFRNYSQTIVAGKSDYLHGTTTETVPKVHDRQLLPK